MRDLIGVALSLALPWTAGALCVLAIRRREEERPWLQAIGYGYPIGAFTTTLVMRLWSAAGVTWSLPAIALPMVALAIAGYWASRPLPSPRARWTLARREWPTLGPTMRAVFWLCFALTAVRLAGLALEVAWRPLLPLDAWSQWATKARVWYEYGRIAPFVAPGEWLRLGEPMAFMDMHSTYPGTIPLLQVWTNLCLGRWDESLMNAPWPALAVALGCAFFSAARRAGVGAAKAMLFTYFLLSLPFLDIHVALAGVVDIFVAATYGMAAMALWQWSLTRRGADLALAALMALACPALKLEGLFWALTLVPPVVVALDRRIGFALAAALVAGAFAWLLFGPEQVVVFGYTVGKHFTNVSLPLLQHLFVMDNWHLLWYAAIAVIALRHRRLFQPELAPLTVAMLGAAGFIAVVFYFSGASGGVTDESLVNRLPLHMVPALAFYLLLLLRPQPPAAVPAIASPPAPTPA